jgi:two-component system, cell cycle response regulator
MPVAARRALIVECSPAQRSVLAALLLETGANFAEAAGTAVALRKTAQQRFDLVCVALELQNGAGVQFCRTLRAAPKTSIIPILALVSNPTPDDVKALLAAGATEVMDDKEVERLRQFLSLVLPPLPVLRGRVLVVEDDLSAAEEIANVLRSLGLEASLVSDPNRALRHIRQQPIDLLISATMLHAPVTGAALVREVRTLPGSDGRTPILAIVSQLDPVRKVEVLRSGADDVIAKPVLAEELTVRVERLLRRKRREEENEAHRATFEALALTDPLTTLNNRRFLGEIGPMYLAEARRHGYPLCVIVVNVDHFEHILSTYESAISDDVLRLIGRLLRSECRRGDVAVRCKDDQFMLLLSHCSTVDAHVKAETLRSRIAGLRPCGVDITVSVGVAQAKDAREEGFAEVFARAGQAAQLASQGGHDRVIVAEA